jgi:3-oxoacyl-[acyl-carrier protein] reductase
MKPLALVTGASRGIGYETAITLAKAGYNIAFCYRNQHQQAETLRKVLEELGAEVFCAPCDVACEQSIESFFTQLSERFEHLDLLVNNAGQMRNGVLATMPVEDMRSVLETNVIGTMLCCKYALQLMIPMRKGCIINLSSVAATLPQRGQANYAASKGAVESLTRALAVEVAGKNIRVNCVSPGVIKTDMAAEMLDRYGDRLRQKLLAKNVGEPDDIARAVLFLADPKNHYITGEVLAVNGGLCLG